MTRWTGKSKVYNDVAEAISSEISAQNHYGTYFSVLCVYLQKLPW